MPTERALAYAVKRLQGRKPRDPKVTNQIGPDDPFGWADGIMDRGGSANIAPTCRAAVGDYAWFANFCRAQETRGLFLHEIGSPGYNPDVAQAGIVALEDARRHEAHEDVAAISRWLRAVWAFWALAAVTGPRGVSTLIAPDENCNESPLSDRKRGYVGLRVALAGNRWNPEADWMHHDPAGHLLAAALDWIPRRDRRRVIETAWGSLIDAQQYDEETPPEIFGLTSDERKALAGCVVGNSIEQSAAYLIPYTIAYEWTYIIRRAPSGTEAVFCGPWPNPEKPAHAYGAAYHDGRMIFMRPGPGLKRGGVTGWTVRVDDHSVSGNVERRDPVAVERMPSAGAVDVVIRRGGVTVAPP